MDLFIDTGRLHFISEPNPYNFDHFQLDTQFPIVRPSATGPAFDINALVAALAAHTVALNSTTSSGTGLTAPAGGALAQPSGTVPVTNIFNYRVLPSDVRLWFYQHNGRKMMTRSVMDVEFGSTVPNLTLDPSVATIRTTLSYLDPPVTVLQETD